MVKVNNKWYIYALLDSTRRGVFRYGEYEFVNEPFYIGMGIGNRMFTHEQDVVKGIVGDVKIKGVNWVKISRIKRIHSKGMGVVHLKIKVNLTKQEAKLLEKSIIRIIGRIIFETGPLTNILEGGEGGWDHVNNDPKKRELVNDIARKMLIERRKDPEYTEKLRQIVILRNKTKPKTSTQIDSARKCIIKTNRGVPHTEERRRKASERAKRLHREGVLKVPPPGTNNTPEQRMGSAKRMAEIGRMRHILYPESLKKDVERCKSGLLNTTEQRRKASEHMIKMNKERNNSEMRRKAASERMTRYWEDKKRKLDDKS